MDEKKDRLSVLNMEIVINRAFISNNFVSFEVGYYAYLSSKSSSVIRKRYGVLFKYLFQHDHHSWIMMALSKNIQILFFTFNIVLIIAKNQT